MWLPSRPAAAIRRARAGKLPANCPVSKKLAGTFWLASVARIAFTLSPLAPASNVRATILRPVGRRSTTRPARDVGTGAVGADTGAGGADVVLARAVEAAGDVAPLEAEAGMLLVAEPVTVASVVGPAAGVCDEDPQAATSISTPTVNATALAPRTDAVTIAHLLRPPLSSSKGSPSVRNEGRLALSGPCGARRGHHARRPGTRVSGVVYERCIYGLIMSATWIQ
jgi:hypothetical protein